MIGKLALVSLLAIAVNGNPYAESSEWKWIHRRITVSPNFKALPFKEVVNSIVPQKPKYPSGTTKVYECGIASGAGKTDRIVGGTEAVPHQFPWQVALFIDYRYFCGGTIISRLWVLTAAHCLHRVSTIQLVFGAHNISNHREESQVSMESHDFIKHEDWDPFFIANDIALIKLPIPLTYTRYIQPVCLPDGDEFFDLGIDYHVTSSGWGRLSDDSTVTHTDILHKVDVLTISNKDCRDYYGNFITENMICVNSTGGRGTCYGDSGGPLNYENLNHQTEVRGIVSFGSSSAGCESDAPDSNTRVNHYLGWIQDHTGINV